MFSEFAVMYALCVLISWAFMRDITKFIFVDDKMLVKRTKYVSVIL